MPLFDMVNIGNSFVLEGLFMAKFKKDTLIKTSFFNFNANRK
ncbi:hypothetical protein ADICYQ_5065 [Cyclobacterium qasimii M12-11B]|uniref:Uncharacterized protein n=1 Tax=Cyclobacterium qasimii M12-11B TaxID=641524 RepID=S7V6P6_9BACT|nr:hypothetical protein ADICYQ_5065 [Cyclobacterium qasimii M12-11B]